MHIGSPTGHATCQKHIGLGGTSDGAWPDLHLTPIIWRWEKSM